MQTQFGPVQVQITVSDGKITKSEVLQVPWSNGRDQEINSHAVPILNSEAVQSQSAQIDMVSGASFTSNGYITRCSPPSTRRTCERRGGGPPPPARPGSRRSWGSR